MLPTHADISERIICIGEERIKSEMIGDGPLLSALVEAVACGEIRGNVGDPLYRQPPTTASSKTTTSLVSPSSVALGNGTLTVSSIRYGQRQPFVSTVTSNGDIQLAWNHFFEQSEQIPTVLQLWTNIDTLPGTAVIGNNYNTPGAGVPMPRVTFAGGVLIQAMPTSSLPGDPLLAAAIPSSNTLAGTGAEQVLKLNKRFADGWFYRSPMSSHYGYSSHHDR
jgi:redox-regulated HSP33 family molecular chaperone